MRHKSTLTPSARLVLATLRLSPTPLTYRHLITETDISLETLRDVVPALVRDGYLNREIVDTVGYYSIAQSQTTATATNGVEVAQ